MKLFGIEAEGTDVALYLPSGRKLSIGTQHEPTAAQYLGRQVLAALRNPDEVHAKLESAAPRRSGAQHLRDTVLELLRPEPHETLQSYATRGQNSTPALIFRTLQKVSQR